MSEPEPLIVALAGNPNTGKSTLFNALTGLNQRTGNFPGVTVEKKTGNVRIRAGARSRAVRFVDLPGAYCLFPKSADELETFKALTTKQQADHPHKVIVVADAGNLKRSLLLCLQVMDLGLPVILAVNMIDQLERSRLHLDTEQLSARLGIPVVAINAREKKGLHELRQLILQETPVAAVTSETIETALNKELREKLVTDTAFEAFLVAANYDMLKDERPLSGLREVLQAAGTDPHTLQLNDSLERYRRIDRIMEACLSETKETRAMRFTHAIDHVFTHPVGGFVLFLAILFLVFQAIFSWAEAPMDMIDGLFAQLSSWVAATLPQGMFNDLLARGVIPGLGGIMMFIPQIAILFGFIAILEDTGYMARVSFIMDRALRRFGINGRSVIPLIGGVACAVPSVMAARTIKNTKERLITILVTPLMSCSARIPVYTLLISFVVTEPASGGLFNRRGLVLMGLYLIGFLAALGTALLLKWVVKSREKSYFIMELPVYRVPKWSGVGYTIYEKVKIFVIDAGKVILAVSVVLFVLASYGPGDRFKRLEEHYTSPGIVQTLGEEEAASRLSSEKLRHSYAGLMGKAIEPVIAPLGFDWKIGIALITSFAAREVFVGTMATIYGAEGEDENGTTLRERMRTDRNARTGGLLFTPAAALSLMIFYAFALQCMSTLAVVRRETGKWKWPLLQFTYMAALAWIASWVTYMVLS